MVRLLMSDEVNPVNLGNPDEMTVLEFAHKVLAVTGSRAKVVFVHPDDERTKDDPMVRQPDISRARQALDWEPAVSLEEGLTRTVEWFKDRLGG